MDSRDYQRWDAADTEDLEGVLARGGSIAEAAELLCRQGAPGLVHAKARELNLRRKPKPRSETSR
nr:hypothetical protein [uncultured Bradyrhizobium sp.]